MCLKLDAFLHETPKLQENGFMSNKYDYSQPINLDLRNDSPEFSALLSKLTTLVVTELKTNHNIKRIKIEEIAATLRGILSSLIVTRIQDPKRYLTYSRNKTWYSQGTRYNPKRFSYSVFTNVMDALESLVLIEAKLGVHDKGGVNSRLSRVMATDQLMALVEEFGVKVEHFKQSQESEVILLKGLKLKGGDKPLIDYADDEVTKNYRAALGEINLRLSETEITLGTKGLDSAVLNGLHPYDVTKKKLVRIFNNGSFEQGGRFYRGWWQEIPSRYRQLIRINGKRTVEMDYSAIHYTLLYAEKQLPVPAGDLYEVDGVDRPIAKKILNIALNANSMTSAITAINRDVLPDNSSDDIKKIVNKCIERHKEISEFFFTGKGLHLQYIDSAIAEDVMVKMWENWGEVVLPVHDSFIVTRGLWAQLINQMQESFRRITGYDCEVKVVQKDNELKTEIEKLAQQVVYDDQGKIIKAGINAADVSYTKKESGHSD